MHYNSYDRFSAPWVDAGVHVTRSAGRRRLWLLEGDDGYWLCAIAGEGTTGGDTREAALENARNW